MWPHSPRCWYLWPDLADTDSVCVFLYWQGLDNLKRTAVAVPALSIAAVQTATDQGGDQRHQPAVPAQHGCAVAEVDVDSLLMCLAVVVVQ